MTLKDLVSSSTLIKACLILWLISSCFIVFILGQIDTIVNKVLYDYGLQFSNNWAIPYWGFLRSIYLFLAIPSFLSGGILVLSIWKRDTGTGRVKPTSTKPQMAAENHLLATCPHCKKVFSKPLTMLDFSQGKTRLVNVCPYCNHILGSAEEQKDLTTVVVPNAHAEKVTH